MIVIKRGILKYLLVDLLTFILSLLYLYLLADNFAITSSISANYADGKYTGTDINFGLGLRGLPEVPVAFSGGANKTVPVVQGDVKSVVNSVKSTVNNSINPIKKLTKKLFKLW